LVLSRLTEATREQLANLQVGGSRLCRQDSNTARPDLRRAMISESA